MTIDTTNMCSHLQRKLFEEDGEYHRLWIAMQDDPELTAVVRSRQLHIYRNGKKVLVLAGKSAPKIIREDRICELLQVTCQFLAFCSSHLNWIRSDSNTAKVETVGIEAGIDGGIAYTVCGGVKATDDYTFLK